MNVGEIKTALKRYGFDDGDPLLSWINSAYHEIEKASLRWPFLEDDEEINAGIGVQKLSLVTPVKRFIKVRDVTQELSLGGEGRDLIFQDRRNLMRLFSNLNVQGLPEYFSVLGTQRIQLYPVPSELRKLFATFVQSLPDLTKDEDIPLIPVSDHYTIVRGAAYIALQAENEEERAASAQAQFESDLSKMLDNYGVQQIGEYDSVQDSEEYAA